MIRVSSSSVYPLLRNFSSRFAAIWFNAQFLSLPLRDAIYVWSLTVNMVLKVRNLIFQFLQCFRLQSLIYWKNSLEKTKNIFWRVPLLNTFFFPEGSTKNIKSSTSNKDISTASDAQEETQRVKKSKGIIMGKLEKWFARIESAQQLLHRTSFYRILELLEHLSMAVQ